MIHKWENDFVKITLELIPFFTIKEFIDKKTGKNLFQSELPVIVADRFRLNDFRFDSIEEIFKMEFLVKYNVEDITISRHVFFYQNAPAVRWYDVFTVKSDKASMYYSDLLAGKFSESCPNAKLVNFFSCSDQTNHRLIENDAVTGKNKGAFFVNDALFIYKEGPMPDCQPIKGEYDFLYDEKEQSLKMLGLGFDNLRKNEKRRANGVVIGLIRDFGLKRYQLERYAVFRNPRPLKFCRIPGLI